MSHMKIEVLDTRGNVVASSGPHNQGNVWGEFNLKLPRNRAMRRFVLHLYNGAGTWYYVDTIQFR